jgi:PAS domain S-box-containing protein
MATVQLFVENGSNRRLLSEALAGEHHVVTGADAPEAFLDADVDLCVFDGPAFRGQRSVFAEKKERAAPVFLPYLLLLGEQSSGQASSDIWERVDEVIETPIERAELGNRVTNLLQRRELSLELKRRQQFTEERFRTLFESTPDPIVVVTEAGVVSEVNDAFVRLFDVTREEIRGEHITDVQPRESVERLLLRVEDGEAVPETEATVEVESPNGDTHVTELNVDVVEELGGVTERIGIFRDVTSRAESQRELERKVDQLEQFASVVSHDLREPLAVAKAKTKLARQECDSEKLDELAAVHDRMDDLVEDVLTLAKQGEPVGATEPVALGDVVTAAWATVATPSGATLER